MDQKPNKIFTVLLVFFSLIEAFILIFLVWYWKELQSVFPIPIDNPWAQAAFQSPIVVGFLRSTVIALSPVIPFFLLSFSLRMLLSKSGKLGPVEFADISERLDQTAINFQKFEEILSELKLTKEENEKLKSIVSSFVDDRRK